MSMNIGTCAEDHFERHVKCRVIIAVDIFHSNGQDFAVASGLLRLLIAVFHFRAAYYLKADIILSV